jgi:AcrR family transcriptional regulator
MPVKPETAAETASEPPLARASTVRSRTRRAVSAADKTARRNAILAAADAHFRRVSFEKFSMEALARELELARGTLYRYFSTREELLLTLYQNQQRQFVSKLIGATATGLTDEAFLRTFYELSLADPTLIALRLRLTNVIEHNVDTVFLLETKQAMSEDFARLSQHLSGVLALPQARTEQLIVALLALLLGAAQADAAPKIDASRLPPEALRIMSCFASETVFSRNAALILSGLRQT